MSSPEGDAEALAHSDSVVDLTGPSSQDGSSPESAQVATMECEPNSAEESSPSPDVAVSTAGTDGNEGGLVVPDGAALSPDMTPQASGPASPVGVSLDAPPLGAAEVRCSPFAARSTALPSAIARVHVARWSANRAPLRPLQRPGSPCGRVLRCLGSSSPSPGAPTPIADDAPRQRVTITRKRRILRAQPQREHHGVQ